MSDFTVKIDGIDELVKRLDEAGKGEYLRGGLQGIGKTLVSDAMKYPPVPEDSRYARTNKLRGSWSYDVSKDAGILRVGTLKESVPYAPYVMGRGTQTRVHELHGWETIESIVEGRMDYIKDELTKFINRVLNGKA